MSAQFRGRWEKSGHHVSESRWGKKWAPCLGVTANPNLKFSRKHGEGFFRWVHLSCSHESHYKVSLQGIIIMKVIARSHCKESLQGVIARSHGKESLQGVIIMKVIARSHCKESLQGVIARSHCKESLQGVMARSHGKEWQGVIARSHCKECKESLQGVIAKCKESSAIDLRGVKISS